MTTISLSGTVDPVRALALKRQLTELCATDRPRIHIDLRAVDDLHLSGVNSIVRALVDARARAGDLTIAAPASGPVRRVLRLTGLEGTLES
ncbi:MAG: STAS domain-containing protein [Acidimicrobiia bacterium]|nr:STAS domain-containing protein [Acidimicrobiia bacterium]